jgi:carbamate kinase
MENSNTKRVVVALGHNALGYTTTQQWDAVHHTAKYLADLMEAGCQLTITHSNGPQVSMIHKAMTELHRIYIDYSPAPMCVCSAMSQGYAGYDIQNALKAELLSRGNSTPVSTILTQVSVDPYDEAFYAPTKKIGRYMSRDDADNELKKGNHVVEEEGKGYLRIVATPKPLEILELDSIRLLADNGQAVICCGGGGIPVIMQETALQGASAVIEKDDIAGKLASDLRVDVLLILTSVPNVFLNFGAPNQTAIEVMNVREAEQYIAAGQFGVSDMLPKIQAAIAYLTVNPSGRVIITTAENATVAVAGKAGTTITA